MTQSPDEIRAKLRELGYLKNPLDRFVFGAGSARGALALALGAGGRGAILAGPLIGLFSIVLLGRELAPDERLAWFLALSLLAALIVFAWVIAQALALHAIARLRGRALETLPAVAVILSGITFLLPALLWLLASRRIQSAALREGRLLSLAIATLLLLAASALIFLATRAAELYATGTPELLKPRSGLRSLVTGAGFMLLTGAVLLNGSLRAPPMTDPRLLAAIPRDPLKANRRLEVVAVDGVTAGAFAREAGTPVYPDAPPEYVKLCEFPADANLIAGWMKVQTGHSQWSGMSLSGLKARWGGRVHAIETAPGRLLSLFARLRLSSEGPLPGRSRRPRFFWEVANRAPALVAGGWHTYPFPDDATASVYSDRLLTSLLTGGKPDGYYLERQAGRPLGASGLTALFARSSGMSSGWRVNDFQLQLYFEAMSGCRTRSEDCPELSWIYLPGIDIACAAKLRNNDCADATNELRALLPRSEPTLLIENPGRRGGTGAIWFRPAKDETIRPIHAPEEVAAAVLDYLGYPLAADLAGVKPEEAKLPSYGTVTLQDPGDASDDATLKALKQLGYIQ